MIVRQHTLNCNEHCMLRSLFHQLAVGDLLEVTDPAGVPDLELLIELLAGQNSLTAVDDDDVIAAVNIRGEIDLVLAAQDCGSLCSGSAGISVLGSRCCSPCAARPWPCTPGRSGAGPSGRAGTMMIPIRVKENI